MRHLRRRASSLGAAPASSRSFARRFASAWWRLAALVAVAFAVQENVEHLIAHGHAPIAGALVGPEYPLALPVIGLVTAIAAALVALVARTQEALVAAIEAALRRPIRAPRLGVRPPATALVPHRFGPRSPRGRPRSSGSGLRLNHLNESRATGTRTERVPGGNHDPSHRTGRRPRGCSARAHRGSGIRARGARGRRLHLRGRLHRRAGVHRAEERARVLRLARGEEPVEGLEETLQAEVTFGSQTRDLEISPRFGEAGAYESVFFPTAAGPYTFRIYGEVEGAAIDESFTSSADGFGEVEELAGGQFPVQFPSTADVVADAEAGAAAATQATIALVLAVIGLLAALVALGLTVARRST